MKKTATLLTVSALILALSACGNSAPAATTTAASEQPAVTTAKDADKETTTAEQTTAPEETTTAETTAKPVENKAGFKQTATIEETVLIDQDGIKVTAKELTYSKYAASIELALENNSDSDIKLMSGTLGYSCNSVNGIMFSGGYFNCELKAGKKAQESLTFKYDELMLYGIDEIADIELGIYSTPGGLDYTYYPVSQIKTSAAGSYDYDNTKFRKSFTNSDMQTKLGYTLKYSAEDKLYDVDDVSIVSEMLVENKDGDSTIIVEAQNDSAYQSRLIVNDIFINGIKVNSSRWTSELINPGKTAMIDVDLSSVFDKSYWEMYGITEVKNVKLGIGQSDMEGKNESQPATIEIPVSGGSDAADTSGTVAYDEGGIRIIYKGVAGGRYDYDDSLYLMFIIENSSGKTRVIDDDYNSFSLNGYMTDSYIYSSTVGGGECAAWKIELPERALDDASVKKPEDIEEIEFGIEVRDENWSNKKEGTVVVKLR